MTMEDFRVVLREITRKQNPHHSHNHGHSKRLKHAGLASSNSNSSSSTSTVSNSNIKIWPGVDETKDRIHLWHKDTERYREDDRYMSAAYLDDVKVITTGHDGCLIRVFDVRHDPYEARNLVGNAGAKNSKVTFGRYSNQSISEAIDKEAAKVHCQGKGGDGSAASHESSSGALLNACQLKYHESVVHKVVTMFPKLVQFVREGNHAHERYLRERKKNTICPVPKLSMVRPLDFDYSRGPAPDYVSHIA
jgi:hypothetical protein